MKTVKWHILFWSLYFTAVYIIDTILDPYATFVKELIFFATQNLFLFYGLLFAAKRFSTKNTGSILLGIVRVLAVIICFILLRYTVRYYVMVKFFDPEYGSLPLKKWFPSCFVWIINSSFYALAYFYFQATFRKKQDLLRMESEKLAEENNALRAQINPHFLYNTLDMLYAKALPKDEELSHGILLLADVMRYSIKPQEAQGFVNLGDEVKHLKNLIEIHRLRFNHKLYLDFSHEGPIQVRRIVPMVLITLVENVFKYGLLTDPDRPAEINLEVDEMGKIFFSTRNVIRKGPQELSSGIGLKNAIKRLQQAYGKDFSLVINDDKSTFAISLSIFK